MTVEIIMRGTVRDAFFTSSAMWAALSTPC
jgi:hypothetical protein